MNSISCNLTWEKSFDVIESKVSPMNSSKKCEAHLTAQRLFQGPKCKTNPRHMPEKIKMQLRMNMQCKHSLHANISPNMTQDSKYLKETSTKYNLITLNFIDGKILKK